MSEDDRTIMKIHLHTGPIGSGKTTRLYEWARTVSTVRGILTPVREGRRVFAHHPTGETREMEAGPEETDVLSTPRYRFAAAAFRWAEERLLEDSRSDPEWLLLDEAGKLEVRGDGFARVLEDILTERRPGNLVLVVRDGLLDRVVERFRITRFDLWPTEPPTSASGRRI
jgi:nucleoside-triphosphatase THEP1